MPHSDLSDFSGSFENFQDPAFAEILARAWGLQVVQRDGLVLILNQYPILGYLGGIMGSPELIGPFARWQEIIHGLNFSSLKVITSEHIDPWERYCISPPDNHNMLLDLSLGEKALFASFDRSCRKAIRSGEKAGVIVREAQGEEDLRAFYQLALVTSDYGRKFDLWPISLIGELLSSKYAKLLVAVSGSHVVGGIFFLLSRHLHLWISGIDPSALHMKPGNLMFFEAILWGMKNGFKYADFGQQGLSQNPGIVQFKMSFNPILKPSYVYQVPGSWIKLRLTDLRKSLKLRRRR
jgi:hypothetical protein